MAIKLIKACKELNIGMSTAIGFLNKLGGEIEEDPNALVDDEFYLELAKLYNQEEYKKLMFKRENCIISNNDITNCSYSSLLPKVSFGLQNFRKLVKLEPISLSHINFIVGANNSGKSTFLKALMLIDNNLNQILSKRFGSDEQFFKFNIEDVHVGTFENALNQSAQNKEIIFNGRLLVNAGTQSVEYSISITKGGNDGSGKFKFIIIKLAEWYNITFDATKGTISIKYSLPIEIQNNISFLHANNTDEQDAKKYIQDNPNLEVTFGTFKLEDPHDSFCAPLNNLLKSLFSRKLKFTPSDKWEVKEEKELREKWFCCQYIARELLKFRTLSIIPYKCIYIEEHNAPQDYWISNHDKSLLAEVIREFLMVSPISDSTKASKSDLNIYEALRFIKKWMNEFQIASQFRITCLDGEMYKMEVLQGSKWMPISSLGRGSIQILTLLLTMSTAMYKHERFMMLIEEPEQNLHPAFQSKLTELFIEASHWGFRFVIETHSEYMVRNSQVQVAKLKCSTKEELSEKNPFKTYYFPNDGTEPYEMIYRTDGLFSNKFGSSFYDESCQLLSQLF